MNQELITVQLAIFFNKSFHESFEELSLKLKERFLNSKSTTILPIPEDAPKEVPRLIIEFAEYKIQAAANRLDIFTSTSEKSRDILSNLIHLNINNIDVNRIGLVKTYFIEKIPEEIKKLLRTDIQIKTLSEITIRVNKQETIENFSCNNIETIEAANVIRNNENTKGIIIQRDINNKETTDLIKKDEWLKLFESFDSKTNEFIIFS